GSALGPAGGQLGRRHHPEVDEQLLQPEQPVLVVSGGQILGGWHLLAGMAPHVDVPADRVAGGDVHGEDAPLPGSVEDGLVLLDLHRTHAVHAAQVVHTVHLLPPGGAPTEAGGAAGGFTTATPIIASRVTSAAS